MPNVMISPIYKEDIEKLRVIFEKIQGLLMKIRKVFNSIFEKYRKIFKANYKKILLSMCGNRKVVHLALYAKRHRTRKKNINRIYKAYLKC